MQISGLPASNSFQSSDVIAIEISGVTYKLTGATLATALKTIGSYAGVSDLPSLPLSVANGGSGLSASPSLLVDLASGSAANVMAASPRPGIIGTLPIANGGTNSTTASGALSNLGGAPKCVLQTAVHTDWGKVFETISQLPAYVTATLYAPTSPANLLFGYSSGGFTGVFCGTITKTNADNSSYIIFGTSGDYLYRGWIQNASSVSQSITRFKYTGSAA